MKLVFENNRVQIWEVTESWGFDFYVYGITQSGDPRICASLGMAMEFAA